MCQMLLLLLTKSRYKNNIFCSDESPFHLNGLVTKDNVLYWSEENPRMTIETVMQSPKVHVCCLISESRMIGPCWFDDYVINGQNFHSASK